MGHTFSRILLHVIFGTKGKKNSLYRDMRDRLLAASGDGTIRWMNVTRYLKSRKNKKSRQIVFDGEELNMQAVWRVRDRFFPPGRGKA